ncbi:2-phosphosulfolactate phosphatase [Serratia fonticola]|uniref:2-phosphosulfolactate phosphatase n=1 Tax=Serratia fonticola TaxID=47917 RepID=UPI00155178F4|nr:2-phosphosulfolactate phosphatase [Serratia fonticola]
MSWYSQDRFTVCLEWGMEAIEHLAESVDCVIIVDVMSFSTCISLSLDRGALVYPYPWKNDSAFKYGSERGTLVASFDRRFKGSGYSLSPNSLKDIEEGTKLILPSPNGSAISFRARDFGVAIFSGCFRNMAATARACSHFGRILVIPCGERWPAGSLRPSVEDFAAAGGIISLLAGRELSPEAKAAVSAYKHFCEHNFSALSECASALELESRGFGDDVRLCLEVNVSEVACQLYEDAYVSV